MSSPKIAIITAVGDAKGSLKDPPIVHSNVDYIAFVGTKQGVFVWKQQHVVKFSSQSYKRNLLLPRILPQLFCANHDYYILIDPEQTVVVDPFELVDKYLSGTQLGLFAHRTHSCVWDLPLTDVDSGCRFKQRDMYGDHGFPTQFGFYDLSLMMMRNSPIMLKMCLCWWEHICRYSALPELSLPYVMWTLGIKPSILPGYAPELGATGDTMGVISMRRN